MGKTRLALEVAGHEKESFRDGAWLCELAPLDDGAAVGHAVAAALRLQQRQGLDIEATVIEYLATRELLLIVDNCEHLLDPSARLVDQIVKHCPRVTVLSTSREALGVEGEQVFAVPPLAVEEATVLFADRAGRAVRTSTLTVSRWVRWLRSVDDSTACPWRSSLQRPACE